MAKKIQDLGIKRQKGKLYFVKGDPLSVYEADMARGKKRGKK